jgi:transketolase
MLLSYKRIKELYGIANHLREDVISMLVEAKSGHSAGPLGMAEIFASLYFLILRHNPKKPLWEGRDRLVLSNGHICPIQYAALARAGYFPLTELKKLRKFGSRLQGHPHRGSLPGVETTSGPLGSGLSQAAGMALAARLQGERHRVYCVLSDAEHNEGNTWEAVLFTAKYRLSNLTAIIDRNNIQISGFTEDVMPLDSLREKYESFGWNVLEVDGHNVEEFAAATYEAKAVFEKPTVIIAHTIPGKGVDFMERKFAWHGMPPNKKQAEEAVRQIRRLQGKIRTESD